jgi:hypothetical protein
MFTQTCDITKISNHQKHPIPNMLHVLVGAIAYHRKDVIILIILYNTFKFYCTNDIKDRICPCIEYLIGYLLASSFPKKKIC